MKKTLIILFVLGLFSCKNKTLSPTELYDKYAQSVVLIQNSFYIEASVNNGMIFYFTLGGNGSPILHETKKDAINNAGLSYGTGFFISEKGEIATNKHVVYPTMDLTYINNEINNFLKAFSLNMEKERKELLSDVNILTNYFKEYEVYLNLTEKNNIIKKIYEISSQADVLQAKIDNLVFNPEKTKTEVKITTLGIAYNNTFVTNINDFDDCVLKSISQNIDYDIAIIQLKNKKTPIEITDYIDIEKIPTKKNKLNDKVYMISYNHGLSLSNTKEGIKSQLNEGNITQESDGTNLLYSIPTLQGSSGSPVFDNHGDLIGINYAKIANSQGFSFGVPALALVELYNNSNYNVISESKDDLNSGYEASTSNNTSEILYGFKLGQVINCIENNFEKPIETIEKYGLKYNTYLLKEDRSSYIVFGLNGFEIESIQLFSLSKDINPTFKGLKMGENKKETIKVLGEPSKESKNEKNGDFLLFDNTNYSVEINQGKLSSIKIWRDNSLYPSPEPENVLTVQNIKSIVKRGNNKEISKLISSNIECSDGNKLIFLAYPWEKEIINDYSGIYDAIKDFVKEIDNLQYEENYRLIPGESPLIVYKFKHPSKTIEIVLKYEYGSFVIWEIKNYLKGK